MDVQFVGGGKIEMTVDSEAQEHVCPWEWGVQFGTDETSYVLSLVNVGGGNIPHWGKREVTSGITFLKAGSVIKSQSVK